MPFKPSRVLFEREALDYPVGKHIWEHFRKEPGVRLLFLKSHNRVSGIPGKTRQEAYQEGKRTLVVGVRKTLDFQTCKPSAHYQLPLVTGCMGQCEYCYLNTQFGTKPYIRVYVNVDEILEKAGHYIEERAPEVTVFEGAATSDPVPVEPYTGSLAAAITFFAGQEHARFRFVTKFTDIDTLLGLDHRGHTTIRYSINADEVIRSYEHRVPSLPSRLDAAARTSAAGYPLGFIIGPVILFDGWQEAYGDMLDRLEKTMPDLGGASFEVISHRYTERARSVITEVFPQTTVPMNQEERRFKFGQFGYGKYVYTPEKLKGMEDFFREELLQRFPSCHIAYVI